jgi:hypothetical protein
MSSLIKLLVIFSYVFSSHLAYGQIMNPFGSKDGTSGGREYFVGTNLGKPLLTVNLVSGVQAPGVYHIPIDTNLAELFSYAGGTLPNSNLEEIKVRSYAKGGPITRTVDFEQIAGSSAKMITLADRDVVHIKQKDGLEKTMRWLSIASILVSMTATIIVISDRD